MVFDILILDPLGFPLPGAVVSFISNGAVLVAMETDQNGYIHISDETDGALLSPGIIARIAYGDLQTFDIDVTRLQPDTEITLVEKTNNIKPLVVGGLITVFLIALYKN